MKKVITVRFEGEGPENCYDLKQWNYGITLRIEGLSLPEKVEVHFALDNSEMAQVYLGTTEDGVTTVQIPAFILENADGIACVSGGKYKAFAYIYQSDEESGWTVRKIIFHIEARQRPEDYIHTEEDIKTWEKLEKRIGEVQKEIPKKVSELDNDEGYLTEESDPTVPGWAKKKDPDKSFTKEGEAADAKAVGDELSKKLTSPQTAKVGQIFRVQAVNEDGTLTVEAVDASECAVTDVTVDGQSVLVENGVVEIPVIEENKFGVAKTLSPYGVYSKNGFLFIKSSTNDSILKRSSGYEPIVPKNLDYAVKCAMCDNIGVAWTAEEQAAARNRMGVPDYVSGLIDGIKTFVAEFGATKYEEIQNAYNSGKDVICKHGWLVAKLDILAPNNYAQFSGLDDIGNPALLKVTKDDVWTRTNVTNATTDYVNGEIRTLNTSIDKQKTFVAEYGSTGYEEILNAFKSNKQLMLHIPYGKTSTTQPEMYAQLVRLDGGGDIRNFAFVCLENNVEHHFVMENDSRTWKFYDVTLASEAYAKIIDNNLVKLRNDVSANGSNISKLLPLLTSAFNSFRGGFCDNAGTLHIKNPGIYLVLQAGTDNKRLVITQNGSEVLNETYNGIIVMAYDSGVITPIGINTSLTLSGTIKMPGTYQGWTSDGKYSTTISYPAQCVVAYLGNSNVNYLA